jgi:PilZ domain-containing protein
MATEKRRSDRLMLTIPLKVQWTDSTGETFDEEARSISLNRHGARIYISRSLHAGQTLHLTNRITNRKADFRVVGPVAPRTDKGGEWGVEYVDSKDNIWAIQFPPIQAGEASTPKALLECRTCHSVALAPLSLVEVDVLDTAGIISRECQGCGAATPWGYAEKQVAMGAPPGEIAMIEEATAHAEASAQAQAAADRRRHQRVCLQLPVLVRDYYGGVEVTKSENVSKGGFCFFSEKNYYVGQGLMAVCPYNSASSSQNIEVRARIVRRQQLEETQRKLYGVRYNPQTN